MKSALLGWLLVSSAAVAATTPAVLFQSAPGRFEIAALNADAAQPALVAAQSIWPALRGPLDLPEAFPSPVLVRVVPAETWSGAESFRVMVEPPGLVSLRIRDEATRDDTLLRRGLAQALLLRLGVAQHGVKSSLTVPLWLELAAVEAWRVSENPSRLDALRRRSGELPPPGLEVILSWQRGEPEDEARSLGAYWMLVWLQAEAARGPAWRDFRRALLGGAEPSGALALRFAAKFSGEAERELWWRTGWHHVRAMPTLPLLTAATSRAAIADTARAVCRRDDRETVVALEEWVEWGRAPWARAELGERARRLAARAPVMHPFYRNAALSLIAVCEAAAAGDAKAFAAARERFDGEWRDASELEAASARALDEWEAHARAAREKPDRQ